MKNIHKLKSTQGEIITDKQQILKTVQKFYSDLLSTTEENTLSKNIPKVPKQCSEDLPEVTIEEINKALVQMKNNKSPYWCGVVTEAIQ